VIESGLEASESAPIEAQVLYEDEPVEGLRVVAVNEAHPGALIELATDEEGRVSFTPESNGTWMLTTIHMIRTDDREDVDWMSYWSSVTFVRGEVAGNGAGEDS